MASRALIDNWTLQNAGELLCSGLTGDTAHDVQFSRDGESFNYREISADVLRIETLCQLLNTIVFADELFIDDKFTEAWSKFEPLRVLQDDRILIAKPFNEARDQWVERREAMAMELCVCRELREVHEKTRMSFARTGQSADEFASQLVWGGAGMLARADFLHVPYVPHSARQRLFSRAGFVNGLASAEGQLTKFVQSERLKIYGLMGEGACVCLRFHWRLSFNQPPLVR